MLLEKTLEVCRQHEMTVGNCHWYRINKMWVRHTGREGCSMGCVLSARDRIWMRHTGCEVCSMGCVLSARDRIWMKHTQTLFPVEKEEFPIFTTRLDIT